MSLAVFTSIPTTANYTWDALENISARVGAHPGWEYVEAVVVGPDKFFVLKCLAASSGLPKDFYVIIRATTGSANATWVVAEDYNSATKSIRRCGMEYGSSSYTWLTTADGSITGDTWLALPTASITNNGRGTNVKWQTCIEVYVGASQEFVLSVQKDCLVIMPRASSARWAGKFISLVDDPTVNDPMPVVVPNAFSGSAYFGNGQYSSTARMPFKPNTLMRHPGSIGHAGEARFASWADKMQPGMGNGSSGDLFKGNKTPMWAYVINSYVEDNAGSNTSTHGWLRGKIESIRYCLLPGATGGYLDEMTVDGAAWVYLYGGMWVPVSA